MTQGERIRYLRKEVLKMSGTDFGKALGFTKSNLSGIENGKTKLADRNIQTICDKFSVNRDWLLTGEGDMFSDNKIDPLELLREEKKLSDFSTALIKAYASLDRSIRDSLDNNIQELINAFRSSGGGYK